MKRYGQGSFALSGLTVLNSLSSTMYDPSLTLTQFCALLKTMLFYRAYETLPQPLCDSWSCNHCCANANLLIYCWAVVTWSKAVLCLVRRSHLLTRGRSVRHRLTAFTVRQSLNHSSSRWTSIPVHCCCVVSQHMLAVNIIIIIIIQFI